ncbi:MAG TPA: class I SAM-dependent methyltransferase [Polyangiaceae bacterium]|nr:class I SAM-dependent methyltransferase [Polyangiaceae bacterium]
MAERRASILRALDKRLAFKGELRFPCMPVMADEFAAKLTTVWATLGRAISSEEREQLHSGLRAALSHGYEVSPHGAIVVSWEASPGGLVTYTAELDEQSLRERYDDWAESETGPLFGAQPDAKVMRVSSTLDDGAPVLDVGAGTGRNALALAAKGHPTDAIELVAAFCKTMRDSAAASSLPLRVFEADILSEELQLEPARYRLAFVSEVLTHFGTADEARALFVKLADALLPGGLLLFNVFLGKNGYEPDRLAREFGHTWFASLFSRSELSFLVDELPFELVSDESVFEFEKAHSEPSSWPPTSWFESWSQGSNVFDVPVGKAPIDLRWLMYRRK